MYIIHRKPETHLLSIKADNACNSYFLALLEQVRRVFYNVSRDNHSSVILPFKFNVI